MVQQSRAQAHDLRAVERHTWPHWTALCANSLELVDPAETRHVRVVLFERLEPGQPTQLAPAFIPRHRNSYDVLSANVALPEEEADDGPEPLGGEVIYRPECLLSDEIVGIQPASPEDHVQVNIYLHTEGPSGAPLVTLDQLADCVALLDSEQPGRMRHERGEFVEDSGLVREALEVCWERIMGRPIAYPDPPSLSAPLIFPIAATPWAATSERPGVLTKGFAPIKSTGVSMRLLKLDAGASLSAEILETARFVAVLAGRIRYEDEHCSELTVIFGGRAQELGRIEAVAPCLLWVIDWEE